ncbi:MAG: mscM [Gammaproteobacteria bacterium]|jgi:potassium efflux system protein|nr:mscM [Gammaproteobacteria bacterium]
MKLKLFSLKILLIVSLYSLCIAAGATDTIGLDKSKVVEQQIELVKNRLVQAKIELANLQKQKNPKIVTLNTSTQSTDYINKQWLNWAKLNAEAAQSNLDGIQIELVESQQRMDLISKDIETITEQLNAFDMFGIKDTHNNTPALRARLAYQKSLFQLEKTHLDYLQKLEKTTEGILQFYNDSYASIEALLKSRTLMQLKERQAKSEMDYQHQQAVWLQRLNELHEELAQQDHTQLTETPGFSKLENQIFYANENVNLLYMKMLVARYQDQIQQLKVSVSRSTSIALLNKVSEKTQILSKQLTRVNTLLSTRIALLEKRQQFHSQTRVEDTALENQYKIANQNIENLTNMLLTFRVSLDQAMKQALSARQGFFGLGAETWRALCNQIILVPGLTFQMFKSLSQTVAQSFYVKNITGWLFLIFCEILWYILFYFFSRFLSRILLSIPDHALGHISLKWLSIKLLHRTLLDIAVLGNIFWVFLLNKIPSQNFNFIIYVGSVWLLFKAVITIARLCLVETVHDRAGHDVRLFYRLKWMLWIGGVITALTVFLYQLPLIETQDFFYRLFLLFLVVVSIFLLRAHEVFTGLILLHIDEHRTYFRRVVRLLVVLFPLVLLVNSAIGFFGFINFVLSVYWYEGIFLVVLVGYLWVRGLFFDVMEYFSHLLIRHVANGWLWTEAFLKPINKIFQVLLFFGAWVVLFFIYGWDRQSLVVLKLDRLLHYHLFDILKTSITFLSIIELIIIISLLYWAARWTREFVYRFLLSRTKDLGVRNSIAILSQYMMILVGVFIGLRVLGIDFGALTVVAGALAFGIGLGLRDLANNFACGFLLLFERPLRVGDTVSINDIEGDVMHMGGRAVTIRTFDHMEFVVPNTEIFNKNFINWTAKDYIVRTVIAIKINRLDDPHEVQELIYKTLSNHKDVLSDPIPEVFLKELAGDLIEFEVRYYINLRQVVSRVSVRSDVLMAIWDMFKQHGIQPPYPHHEVHIQ